MKDFYYQCNGEKYGPYSFNEIVDKKLPKGTYIWHDGLDSWVLIENVPLFRESYKSNKWGLWKAIGSSIALCVGAVLFSFIFVANIEMETLKAELELKNKISKIAYDDPSVDFQMYLDQFYKDLKYYNYTPKQPDNIIIKFAELNKIPETRSLAGISLGYNKDYCIEIYIDPAVWLIANDAQRYWIIYHELAHDILNLDHVDETQDNVGQLMYPEIPENYNMDDFKKAYHEAFSQFTMQHHNK
jgi:hypothetical protein